MNSRGIFITFMVFLLAASVILLHDAAKLTDTKQEEKYIDESAFNKVNNSFNNIYEEVVSFNKEGYAKNVQQRPMPFGYDFNANSIILRQRVPVRASLFRSYIDALNIYRIFAESQAADLNVIASAIQDERWNANEPAYNDLNFVILPQCLLYDLNVGNLDANYFILKKLAVGEYECVFGFNYSDFNKIDINLLVNTSGCGTAGYGGTMNKSEEALETSQNPYFMVTVNEINPGCPGTGCLLTGQSGKEIKKGHFNPATCNPADEVDALLIQCNSGDWLRVKLGEDYCPLGETDPYPIVIYNFIETRPVEVDLNITFDSRVELFYFTGFDVSVEKKNFDIKRST